MNQINRIIILLTTSICLNAGAHNDKIFPLSYLDIDGIHATEANIIFAADGFNGSKIYYITPEGITYDFADGLSGPIDITDDRQGNLFVTNFNAAKVSKISATGEVTDFADVLEGPAGIVTDSQGNMFVSHYGTGTGNGDSVLKITPDGEVSVFAQGGALNAPVGTAIDEHDNIYTANFNDGIILKISPDGEQKYLAQIPSSVGFAIGHLAYAKGKLFATGVVDNSVYVIREDGSVKLRKNLGEGNFPNGITFDASSNSLLVAKAFAPISSLIKIKMKRKP